MSREKNNGVTSLNWRLYNAYSKSEIGSASEEAAQVFDAISALSKDELIEIDDASKQVRSANSSLHIARAVIQNRNELLDTIVQIGTEFLNRSSLAFNEGTEEPLADLSCKLLNLCASFRSYLEHQETYLKRGGGRNSAAWGEWRSILSEVETKNKYYGLIYGLRNYIQHVDMPPLHLSLHSESADAVTLSLGLIAKDLLMPTAQWSPEMRSFISSFDDEISLWDALNGWDEAFRAIIEKGREVRTRPAKVAAELIVGLRKRFNAPNYGTLGVAPDPQVNEDGSFTLNIRWIEEKTAAALLESLEQEELSEKQSP